MGWQYFTPGEGNRPLITDEPKTLLRKICNNLYQIDVQASTAVWGSITGTLSNQTDLQSALDAKLAKSSNLSDLTNAGTARTNLALGNVNNTSDANKPVSTAQQSALDLKSNLANPAFTTVLTVNGTSETAPPQIRENTSDLVGRFTMFGESPTDPNNPTDWSTFWLGNNLQPDGTGQSVGIIDSSKGAVSLTMENHYNYNNQGNFGTNACEFYVNNHSQGGGGGAYRMITAIGNQADSNEGTIFLSYPTFASPGANTIDGTFGDTNEKAFNVVYQNDTGGKTIRAWNPSVNASAICDISLEIAGVNTNTASWLITPSTMQFYRNSDLFIALQTSTSGILMGSTITASASEKVHIVGNLRLESGVVKVPTSTASAPTLTNTGATNKGFYFASDYGDLPAICENGTLSARFYRTYVGFGNASTPKLAFNWASGGAASGYQALQFDHANPFTIGPYSTGARFFSLSTAGAATVEAGDLIFATAGKGTRFASSTGPLDTSGSGSPESAVTAPIGSTFRRTDGGAGTSIYIKESGSSNTGWSPAFTLSKIQTQRVTTGSVSGAATALVTITWGTAFADTNYTVSASVLEATTSSLSMSVVHVETISASAITVRVLNNAVGALTGTVHAIAIHD